MTTSMTTTRRRLAVAVGLVADVHLFLVLSLLLWLVLPTVVLGWGSVLVASGSMSPVIRPGDIVLLDRPGDGEFLRPGTVVTYRDGDSDAARLVTHRVRRTDPAGTYVTRGDANRSDDLHPVPHERVQGYGRLLVPLLGLPAYWARTGHHLELSVFVLATMAAMVTSVATAPQVAAAAAPAQRRVRRQVRRTIDRGLVPARGGGRSAAATRCAADDELLFARLPGVPAEPSWWSDVPTTAAAPCRSGTTPARTSEPSLWGAAQGSTSPRDVSDTAPVRASCRHDVGRSGTSAPNDRPGSIARPRRRLLRWSAIGLGAGMVLFLGGLRLPVADAALTAATGITGNTFSTAEASAPGLPTELVLATADQAPSIEAGQQPTTVNVAFPVTAVTSLQGMATAEVRVRPSTPGNPERSIGITLRTSDGSELAAGRLERQDWERGWTTLTLDLTPILATTLPAGETLTVAVEVRRLELALGGASVVLLPVQE